MELKLTKSVFGLPEWWNGKVKKIELLPCGEYMVTGRASQLKSMFKTQEEAFAHAQTIK
jgi:hypothetical protein